MVPVGVMSSFIMPDETFDVAVRRSNSDSGFTERLVAGRIGIRLVVTLSLYRWFPVRLVIDFLLVILLFDGFVGSCFFRLSPTPRYCLLTNRIRCTYLIIFLIL